jgi:ATP-dependent DNA helicase RecQ
LFLVLKALRLRLAHAQRVPPYVIFPDKALADMAQRQPRTPDDFAQIHGVGKAKVEKFASPFLQEIAGFLSDTTDA